jgi:tRNA(fMet)-specific endonuclease VapC
VKTVLPDTIVIIDLLAGDRSFEEELSSADRILVTPTIVAEYLAGIRTGKRDALRRQAFEDFLEDPAVVFLPHDRETASRYASLHQYLRRAGTPLPINDIWIAASALQHSALLLTRDRHFEAIPLLGAVIH